MEDEVEDYSGEDGQYSGTFRWKKSKVLKSMPPSKVMGEEQGQGLTSNLPYRKGWMSYLTERAACSDFGKAASDKKSPESFIRSIQEDLSIIDCLSSPLSICHIVDRLKLLDPAITYDSIAIICIGCSSKGSCTQSLHSHTHTIIHSYTPYIQS